MRLSLRRIPSHEGDGIVVGIAIALSMRCRGSEGGRKVFGKRYGMASLEHDVPITPTSAFYAAHVSKQFTAFSVAADAEITLQPVFSDAFNSPNGVVRFTRMPSGRVTGLVIGVGRVTGFVFRRTMPR